MTGLRSMRSAVALVATIAILSGCGQMPATVPATPTAEQPAASTPGTPPAGSLTLGELAARVNAAWPAVMSYRVTFTGLSAIQPSAAGTPVARPPATPDATPLPRSGGMIVSVREVVLPDRQRQDVTGLGADDHEAIATGGKVFIRGPLAGRIAPGTPPDVWLSIDAASLPARSTLSALLGGLPALPGSPLATIPERLWPQSVRDLGVVEFDGRECHVYGAANTVTQTGMRVDYAIAVDDRDLPCFIETSAGGTSQGRNEYQNVDAALTIVAPADATPVAIPPALATPSAHD